MFGEIMEGAAFSADMAASLIDGGAGTDDFDFTTAMYGDLIKYIDRNTGEASQFVHARND